jgi:hypothetical protein
MGHPLGSHHDRPRDDHGERAQAPATAGEDRFIELLLSLLMSERLLSGVGYSQ